MEAGMHDVCLCALEFRLEEEVKYILYCIILSISYNV